MAEAFHPDQLGTLYGLFQARVSASPNKIAYRQFDPISESWVAFTWAQIEREVRRWQAALIKEGLASGDRVAVMLKNCVEWVIFDQAALGLGLVVVPLYPGDSPENAAYILDHSGARMLLIEGKFQHRKMADIACACPNLQVIVSLEAPTGEVACGHVRFSVVQDWLASAVGIAPSMPVLDTNALASIVYTSGTTGRAKGVMLTHANMLWNAYYATQCISLGGDDVFLSFLPLSHTLERTAGYYWPMMLGAEVAYARSITELAQDLITIRPTVLVSVPRIFERIYGRIQHTLSQKKPLARKLFALAVNVGWRRFEISQRRAKWHPDQLLGRLLNRLVARSVTDKFGGRVFIAISGGAALSPEIARMFISLGVPIYQGYGLTETSPIICVNRPLSNFPASIGQALPEVEVRVGEQDELLTRSKCVMRGYWRNEEATHAVIDAEGWLHSGDKVSVNAQGHYFIVGRIKDIIVLSNGEKISPADMEAAILLDPLFEQVMIVGEGKAALAALIVLNAELWQALAISLGGEASEASLQSATVRKALRLRVNAQTRHFPGYTQIRQVRADLIPWTAENGLLTPTLKVKRGEVCKHYRSVIEAMHAEI